MREEVYGWMKQLAVYYIFLTAVMNVLPDEKYARYIRYFAGLLLILLLTSPLFGLLRLDGQVNGQFWEELLESGEEQKVFGGELQTDYLRRAYQAELERQITERLRQRGILAKAEVVLSENEAGGLHRITVTTEEMLTEERKEAALDELEEVCGDGAGRENVCFAVEETREGTVGSVPSGGDSSGGDRSADREGGGQKHDGTESLRAAGDKAE